MAIEQQKKPRTNTSLREWFAWTNPHRPFYDSYLKKKYEGTILNQFFEGARSLLASCKNYFKDYLPQSMWESAMDHLQAGEKKIFSITNNEKKLRKDATSLWDRTLLGASVHSFLKPLANPFWNITWNNDTKWSPLARILTAPVFAALVLPLELWRALDFLVACVATPLLWAGQRMMNAMLDVFKPLPDESGSDEQPRNPGPDASPQPNKLQAENTVLHSRSASPDPEVPSSDQNRAGTPSPQ